jgi:alcohol dehydrogenase (NADP+)
MKMIFIFGSVAQLVERTTENREVTGSTPVGATETPETIAVSGFSFNGIFRQPTSVNPGMTTTRSLIAPATSANFEAADMPLRPLGPKSVKIKIAYSGICHSDIHQVRGEWSAGNFPMVPGHEIAGHIVEVGSEVTKFKVGDRAGVGVFVDSCRECENCKAGYENQCLNGSVGTYNSRHKDGTISYGGYAHELVVDEHFALHIPEGLDLAAAAPLLCAGITVYSPLKRWNVGPGKKVAILGLGGLGHLAVKIAVALGADVTVLGHSLAKKDDALSFGAHDYRSTEDAFANLKGSFDMILNTTSADLNVDGLLSLLRMHGALVNVGLPGKSQSYNPFSIIGGGKSIAGSNTGGIPETQQMLDFCAEHGIVASIELLDASNPATIDAAYDRVVASDVRYRFVIDAATI